MKVYFIYGFLGSGKTTLINFFMEYIFTENKVVILENESGKESVDGILLKGRQYTVCDMKAGCICCTLRSELPAAIDKIREDYNPDIILVETAGIASLEMLLGIPRLQINSVMTLLDVTRYDLLMSLNLDFYKRQFCLSPVLFLTKTELITSEQLRHIKENIKSYAPHCLICDDYRKFNVGDIIHILEKSSPYRIIMGAAENFDISLKKTYFLDEIINQDFCLNLLKYTYSKDKDLVLRAKGILRSEENLFVKIDIDENQITEEVVKDFEGEPFLSIWWNKNKVDFWKNWFESFFQPKEVNCITANLHISDSELWNYMGFKDSTPDDFLKEMISSLKQEAFSVCNPKFGYRFMRGYAMPNKELIIGNQSFSPKGIIYKCLEGADAYALIVASVGHELDEWIEHKRNCGDIMEAFIADALGSAFAEAIVAWGTSYLEQEMREVGWSVSNSYSPGYCGWDVKEQQKFFSMLPEKFCGVALTDSSLMLPIKSVSTVVAVGEKVIKQPYGCAICKKKDCYKRNMK